MNELRGSTEVDGTARRSSLCFGRQGDSLASSLRIRLVVSLGILLGLTLDFSGAGNQWGGSIAHAGGGPENVFLVVNSADRSSVAIANYFVDFRNIPSGSVFYIDWPNPPHDTSLTEFRDRILQPTLDAIKARGLESQIDYIVYSSGFPYRVDYEEDIAKQKYSWASITSLTYLYQYVLEGQINMLEGSSVNSYARNLKAGKNGVTRGFRHRYGLDLMGERVEKESKYARRFYLSMMLGYTAGKGNSVNEVMRYLMFAARADHSQPKGTIYFLKNKDVRSTTRLPGFADAVDDLLALGVNAEVLEVGDDPVASLPRNKNDIQGAMLGYPKARWAETRSEILPGAIVETLTSYGGRMEGNHSQVVLNHFLKYGAVASSGTVMEPTALQRKFPHPRMHVHYARGCSVAEAFYQSVSSPYQLVMVGDPLCQPWSVPPEVKISGLNRTKKLKGTIEFTATAKSKKGNEIRSLEAYVDGKFQTRVLPGDPIKIDTTKFSNGYHELRVVAIEDTPIETQGRAIAAFVSANTPARVSSENDDPKSSYATAIGVTSKVNPKGGLIRSMDRAYVQVKSPNAAEIRLYKGREMVGSVRSVSGRIPLEPSKLGAGPVKLQAVAFPKNKALKPIFGFPFNVTVAPTR